MPVTIEVLTLRSWLSRQQGILDVSNFRLYARHWNAGPRVPFQARRSSYPNVYIQSDSLSCCLQHHNSTNFTMVSHASTLFFLLTFFLRTSSAFPGLNFLQPRAICYEDDVLQSFQTWEPDSVPYCSSLLGISDHTTFSGPTKSYTYVVLEGKCVNHLRVAELPSQPLQQLAMIH